jgi:cation transport ATPase
VDRDASTGRLGASRETFRVLPDPGEGAAKQGKMGDDLHNIPYVVDLSRQTRKTLIVNLGFAMTMIVIMIGGIFAYAMPPPLAVVGHEGGTVLVSLNGLRLLLYRRRRRDRDGH